MSNRLLAIPKEGVWCPHLSHHQVVKSQNLYGALIHQPAVHPRLSKEHVHCVLLKRQNCRQLQDRKSEVGLCCFMILTWRKFFFPTQSSKGLLEFPPAMLSYAYTIDILSRTRMFKKKKKLNITAINTIDG